MTFHACWALLSVFLVIVLPAPSQAQEGLTRRWSVRDYPDPQRDWTRCGRTEASAVCDPNRIITGTQADAIDDMIERVYMDTVCPCSTCQNQNRGYIIRVALMPYFERIFSDGDNSTLGMLRDAQMYSYMLSEYNWNLHGTCNETVLIMYARDDNMLYTLTRRTSKVQLNDNLIQRIMMIVRHYFDNRNTIADGLLEMIRRYKLVFLDRHDEAVQDAARVR